MPIPRQMPIARREFLALGAAGALVSGNPLVPTGPALAADPVIRSGGPLLKLSLAGYSFHSFLPRRGSPEQIAAARMKLEDFIHYCAEQGLGATELTGYYFPQQISTAYLLRIRQLTHRLGLSISATAIGNDFCLPDGAERQRQLAECREWIDYAAIMGAPAIRIFAGKVPEGDSEAAAVERCVAGINDCLKYAAEKGVFLALENHGGITATADQMLKIIRAVDPSPWFGVNFDSGNFQTADPWRDLERIAPYAVNAQIKVSILPGGVRQPADFRRIAEILKKAGYRGYVALEYEEPESAFDAVPRYLQQLREALG